MSETDRNKTQIKDKPFFPFKVQEENQKDTKYVSNLLKKTKALVLSNNNYNNFMKHYNFLTQESTFKLPEITQYPILKNEEMIPVNRNTYSSGSQYILHNEKRGRPKSIIIDEITSESNNNTKLKYTINSVTNQENINLNYININIDINNTNKFSCDEENNKNNNENILYNKSSNEFPCTVNLKNRKILYNYEKKLFSNIKKFSDADEYIKSENLIKELNPNKNNCQNESHFDFLTRNLYFNPEFKMLMIDLLCDFDFGCRVFNYDSHIRNKFNEKSVFFDNKEKLECLGKLKSMVEGLIEGKNQNVTSELKKTYGIIDKNNIELKISSVELEFIPLLEKDYNTACFNSLDEKNSKYNFTEFNPQENNYFNSDSDKYFKGGGNKDITKNNNKSNYFSEDFLDSKNIKKIKIPFSVLPVFYYSSWENFFCFLSKIIKNNNFPEENGKYNNINDLIKEEQNEHNSINDTEEELGNNNLKNIINAKKNKNLKDNNIITDLLNEKIENNTENLIHNSDNI